MAPGSELDSLVKLPKEDVAFTAYVHKIGDSKVISPSLGERDAQ